MSKTVALIRGNSLNAWEGKLWENLPGDFSVTGFCAKNNLYPIDTITYPVVRLAATTDSKLCNGWASYVQGQFQKMYHLERELQQFSIAHTTEIYNYYTTQAVAAKKSNPNLKVVTTVWDNSFERFERSYTLGLRPPAWWTKKMRTRIAANAAGVDCFIAVSSSAAKLLRKYGVPEQKIRQVMPALVEYRQDASSAILTKHGLVAPMYLMVNRLTKEKGIFDVIAAWKKFVSVSKKSPQLVIVGDGPERAAMLAAISEAKLTESIRYIPSLPNQELRQLYPHARALILASVPTPLWEEQFGYVLAEAMVSGCPVISTMTGAIPEVVGEGGILVPPHDPAAIAQALQQLENDQTHASYAAKARANQQRFTAQRFQTELTNIYNEVL